MNNKRITQRDPGDFWGKKATKYDPDQPREPEGVPTGGQWTEDVTNIDKPLTDEELRIKKKYQDELEMVQFKMRQEFIANAGARGKYMISKYPGRDAITGEKFLVGTKIFYSNGKAVIIKEITGVNIPENKLPEGFVPRVR